MCRRWRRPACRATRPCSGSARGARRHAAPGDRAPVRRVQQGAEHPGSRAPDQGRARGGAERIAGRLRSFIRAEYGRWPAIVKAAGTGRRSERRFHHLDQQRGDCYGFEAARSRRRTSIAWRAGTRFSACITPNSCASRRAPRSSPVCCPTRTASRTTASTSIRRSANRFRRRVRARGLPHRLHRQGTLRDLAHLQAHRHARVPQQRPGPELVRPLHGLRTRRAGGRRTQPLAADEAAARPALRALVPQGRPRRGVAAPLRDAAAAEVDRDADVPFRVAGRFPQFDMDWRPNHLLHQKTARAVLRLGIFSRPHHPFDAPEPWSRLHYPDEVDLPPERKLDLERRPWWHRQSLEGKPQIVEHLRRIREQYSRIPVHTDQQLRELIANYYGMISLIDHNVGRIVLELEQSDSWRTRCRLLHRPRRLARRPRPDPQGADGVRGAAARRTSVPGARRAERKDRRGSGLDARFAGDLHRLRGAVCAQAQPQLARLIDGEERASSRTANGTCAPRAPASTSICARCARGVTSSRWICAPARASSTTLRRSARDGKHLATSKAKRARRYGAQPA